MINLDERAFEKILSTCVLQYGLQRTVMEVVFPFMSLVGAMWQTGSVNPAFEHFMSNLIRQKLIVAIDAQEIRPVAHPKISCSSCRKESITNSDCCSPTTSSVRAVTVRCTLDRTCRFPTWPV